MDAIPLLFAWPTLACSRTAAHGSTRTGREPRGQKKGRKGQKMADGNETRPQYFLFDFKMFGWLGFLDTYRTMCLAPDARFTFMLRAGDRAIDLDAALRGLWAEQRELRSNSL